MKKITVIICGTIHDTYEETKLFGILNNMIKESNSKNILWLCEGESYDRECTSLKDNTIHLLTDSLFVNMLILDFVREDVKYINDKFVDMLYNRSIELFVTIAKFDNEIHKLKDNNCKDLLCNLRQIFTPNFDLNLKVQTLIKSKYQEFIDMINNSNIPIKQIHEKIKHIPLDEFMIDMRESISKIIMYMKERNMIDKNYEKCVFDFYETGLICEDTILTVLREQSFIKLILEKINSLAEGKYYIFVTVGADHCNPLSMLLQKFNIKTKVIKFIK